MLYAFEIFSSVSDKGVIDVTEVTPAPLSLLSGAVTASSFPLLLGSDQVADAVQSGSIQSVGDAMISAIRVEAGHSTDDIFEALEEHYPEITEEMILALVRDAKGDGIRIRDMGRRFYGLKLKGRLPTFVFDTGIRWTYFLDKDTIIATSESGHLDGVRKIENDVLFDVVRVELASELEVKVKPVIGERIVFAPNEDEDAADEDEGDEGASIADVDAMLEELGQFSILLSGEGHDGLASSSSLFSGSRKEVSALASSLVSGAYVRGEGPGFIDETKGEEASVIMVDMINR